MKGCNLHPLAHTRGVYSPGLPLCHLIHPLILALAIVTPCFRACAGDKIEFSVPTVSLGLPVPDKTQDDSFDLSGIHLNDIGGMDVPQPMPAMDPVPILRHQLPSLKDFDPHKTHADTSDSQFPGGSSTGPDAQTSRDQAWTSETPQPDWAKHKFPGAEDKDKYLTSGLKPPGLTFDAQPQTPFGVSSLFDRKTLESTAREIADTETAVQQAIREEQMKTLLDMPNSTTPAGAQSASGDLLHNYTWQSTHPRVESESQMPANLVGSPSSDSSYSSPPSWSLPQKSAAPSQEWGQGHYGSAVSSPSQPPLQNRPAVLPFPGRPDDITRPPGGF